MNTTRIALRGALLAASLSCGLAMAAGGHHAVDDAAILDPGNCEIESWIRRADGGERLLHAGGICRVGPVELGIGSEYSRAGGSSGTDWGFETKWATPIAEGFSVGASLGSAWSAHVHPHYRGAALVGLATWEAGENLALHLNLGREFVNDGADENRYGASIEWRPTKPWSLVGERYRALGTQFARLGVRWFGSDTWNVDLSRSQRLSGPGASAWTLGATFQFDRN